MKDFKKACKIVNVKCILIIIFPFFINLQAQEGITNNSNRYKTQKDLKISVELSLPKEMFVVEENRLEIFKYSIINAINPDNYFLNVKVIEGLPKGEFYDRIFVYDCMLGDGNMTLEFSLMNQEGLILSKRNTIIKPVKKAVSPESEFNILLIGDSFTASATYPEELKRRLTDIGGAPKGDNLSNINFIGTTPKETGTNREGHSGKSWSYFLSDESPFFNIKNNEIDFSNYVAKNAFSSIDAVVIMLGTNSISNNKTVSSFLDKLIEFNPNIKGIVTGKILATPLGGGGVVGVSKKQTFYGSFSNTFIYNRRMENLIRSDYSTNFIFVDLLPSFDIMYNMKFAEVPANFRNKTQLVKQGTDNVHPAESGYLQIADIIYNAIHGFILKNQ